MPSNSLSENGPDNPIPLAALIVACLALSACVKAPPPAGTVTIASTFACGKAGQLTTDLFGSIAVSIDWQADEIACEGMPRPDNEGARLRLSGPYKSGEEKRTLTFILGLPDLVTGQEGKELSTNVTVIEEGSGRFFTTPDTGGCWTDVTSQHSLAGDSSSNYQISGVVYCASPLAQMNGNANVSLNELRFTGLLDWNPVE